MFSINKVKVQSFDFLKNSFMDFMESGVKVFGITTSMSDENYLNHVVRSLSDKLSASGEKVVVFTDDKDFNVEDNVKIENTEGLSKKDIRKKLEELVGQYDVVIFKLHPLHVYSDALESAKLCDKLFSVEKYQKTYYKSFEDMLYIVRGNALELSGVISYK